MTTYYRAIFVGELRQSTPLAVENVLVMGRQSRLDKVHRFRKDSRSLRLQQLCSLQLGTEEKPNWPHPLLDNDNTPSLSLSMTANHRLDLSRFYSKTGFWPSYCQISTDLDNILHTTSVVRNTLVGLRLVRGRLQAKPERLCFCNTCNAP